MTYIDNLEAALKKREKKLKCTIAYCSSINCNEINLKIGINFPPIVKQYFNRIEHLKIDSPRHFEMLPLNKISLFDDQFLFFSIINNEEKICFDISHINEADQWDIVNFNNKYLITKTMSSYLINKIWAWIDRDRKIWQEEFYTS